MRSDPVSARSTSRTSDIPPRPKVCVKRIAAAGTRTGRRWRTKVPTTVRALRRLSSDAVCRELAGTVER
jgi:hypothetical protein